MPANNHTLSEAALCKLCEEVQVISMQVGKFIREERKNFNASDVELKGVSNLVSYVDKTAEKQFVEKLKAVFPEAGFIAEEDASLEKAERYNWVIDPLDGTTNFVHDFPCYATSVALLDGNKILLGVVYAINLDECFYAWKNGGAWKNGERISVSKTNIIRDSLIATGFPYDALDRHETYMKLYSEIQQGSHGIRRAGSAATDTAYVACGRFEAYYEYGLQAWDMAAGALLVKEAGGIVTDFSGGNNFLSKREFLCGTSGVHAALLERIKKYFPVS